MGYNITINVDSDDITDAIEALESSGFRVDQATMADGSVLDNEYVVDRGDPTGADPDGTVDVATDEVERTRPGGPDVGAE